MTKVIAIIGDGGTGKSTLIRHITGVARTKDIILTQLSGRNVSVHVRPQSPQEPPVKILPLELCVLINESRADYAIIALRIVAIRNAPDYEEYLRILTENDFIIDHVIQLGREAHLRQVTGRGIGILPNNQDAAAIRRVIGFF